MAYAIRVEPGSTVRLGEIPTRVDGGLDKAKGETLLVEFGAELDRLQELLYAAGTRAVLVVLQGMDTSGKDGAIRTAFDQVNPQGIRVAAFKAPTAEELAHDFLWRVHKETPELGTIGVFNRSHYEDVLIARVRKLVPEDVWRPRYEQINAFERLLSDSGTIVLKFFLHISAEEQERRLLAREEDVAKAWKLNVGDWQERPFWDAYQEAYAEAIGRCSTPHAPWYVVPADRKWFRNLAIAEAVVEALRPHEAAWVETLRARGEDELAKIAALRDGEVTALRNRDG